MAKNFGIVDPKDYIGLKLEVAKVKAQENGFSARIVEMDGRGLMVTEDLKNNRLNLRVRDGVIIDAYPG